MEYLSRAVGAGSEDTLAGECVKAGAIFKNFVDREKAGKGTDAGGLDTDALRSALGVVLIRESKASLGLSTASGRGLILVRRGPDGKASNAPGAAWSAPAAIGSSTMGSGAQVGYASSDILIVIHTYAGVELLTSEAGPAAPASRLGNKVPPFSSYSISTSGLFVGLSIDASVLHSRDDANKAFYGRAVAPKDVLSGAVDVPVAAKKAVAELHAALKSIDTLRSSASRPQTLTSAHAL